MAAIKGDVIAVVVMHGVASMDGYIADDVGPRLGRCAACAGELPLARGPV
jgi:hypothetical protein